MVPGCEICNKMSFIAACGFWKPSIEDRGMNYFTGIIVSVRQRLPKKNSTNTLKFG